jgi:hypothetical protein
MVQVRWHDSCSLRRPSLLAPLSSSRHRSVVYRRCMWTFLAGDTWGHQGDGRASWNRDAKFPKRSLRKSNSWRNVGKPWDGSEARHRSVISPSFRTSSVVSSRRAESVRMRRRSSESGFKNVRQLPTPRRIDWIAEGSDGARRVSSILLISF